MALFIVTYDLKKVGQNYECISKKLEALGDFWHFQQSVWLVGWDGDAFGLANELETCLDSNDTLFVTRVTSDSAWSGLGDDGDAWIAAMM